MSKKITSPVPRFPGTVTLMYPLNMPAYSAWKACVNELPDEFTIGDVGISDELTGLMLPGICACVEKWDIVEVEGEPPRGTVTPNTFPISPRISSARLVIWLFNEISKMTREDETEENDPLP